MSLRASGRRFIALSIVWIAIAVFNQDAAAQDARADPPRGRILGAVASADSGSPLASVAVTIRSAADSAVVTGVLTGRDGKFRIDGLEAGEYIVHVSVIGYASHVVEDVALTAAAPTADLGVLELDPSAVELDAIEARAERAPVVMEIDRTVYATKDMPAASGGTADDLLRQVPELEVDIDGNVSLRGQRAAIHINGRPAPLRDDALTNFLRQMPADRVGKVEVIPNPSARHDPEGMGGIVNLVLDEGADLGLSGSLSVSGSTPRGSNAVNGRLAYQRGRLTLFGGGGLSRNDYLRDMVDVRRNLLSSPVTSLEQEGRQGSDQKVGMLDLTAEVKVGARTTAWLNGVAYLWNARNDASILYGLFDNTRSVLDRYDRITALDEDYTVSDFAVGFKHSIVPQRHELTVDLRRNRFGSEGSTSVDRLSKLPGIASLDELLLTGVDIGRSDLTLRVDYSRPWGPSGRLDIGLNVLNRTHDDESLQELFANGGTDAEWQAHSVFVYDESFQTLYVSALQTFGKLGVQVGVRAERAATDFTLRVTDERFDDAYRTVFPNVNVSWDAGDGRQARLSYSKRIARPAAELLNPYSPSNDPLNRHVGNPYLGPSYAHSFGLDLSQIGAKGTLRLSPYYRRTVDGWESIKTVDEAGVSTVSFQNTACYETLGTSLTASLQPIGRLSGSANINVFHASINARNVSPEFSRTSLQASASLNGAAKLTSALSAQVTADYRPARTLPQGRASALLFNSIGLRQQLLAGKATLSLFAQDPFDLARYTFETSDQSHIQRTETRIRGRGVALRFAYNFGRPPEQVSRREEAPAAEQAERIP